MATALDRGRITRALHERIYLHHAEDDGQGVITYIVTGQSGIEYRITINPADKVATCTCPDHTTRGSICKHILYVLFRVLRAPLDYTGTLESLIELTLLVPRYSQATICDSDLLRRLWSQYRAAGATWAEPRWERGDECPICFEELKPEKEYVHWCRYQCGKCIHRDCYNHLQMNAQCPLCRARWRPS